MNRVVKFRGLDYSDNMVYGSLIMDYRLSNTESECVIRRGNSNNSVIKKTVGQFTGLLDKNDREIYEGDIYIAHGHKYTVFYKNGAFCGGKSIEKCAPIGWEPEEGTEEEYTGDLSISFFCSEMEVIGNIYEKEC